MENGMINYVYFTPTLDALGIPTSLSEIGETAGSMDGAWVWTAQ